MMIYNKNTKPSFFHDGDKWLSLGGRVPPPTAAFGGSITYRIVAAGFSGIEMPAFSAQPGAGLPVSQPSPPGLSSASEFVFSKQLYITQKVFNRLL
jgi:hypothetical protein